MQTGGSVESRIEKVRSELNGILSEFMNNPDAPIFALRDKAMQLLKSQDLVRTMLFHSRHVAVHMKNRYGDGIIPSHVADLVNDFVKGGFSLVELGAPIACEIPPPGHARHDECLMFVKKVVDESNGLLAPYVDDEIKILSCTKSHTTQATRCVFYGTPHDNENITEHGRLSLHKISLVRPSFSDAVSSGYEWDVLAWQAEDAFAGIVELLQEAGNAGHGIAKAETRLEVCLKMHNKAQTLLQSKKPPLDVWSIVELDARRAKSTFASEVPDLRKFVEKFSGGEKAIHLEQFVQFQRTLKHPRVVHASFMASVAELVLGPDGRGCTNFRLDLIKAMMSTTEKYTGKDGNQVLITTVADLKRLQEKKVQPMLLLADKMKSQGNSIVLPLKVDEKLAVPVQAVLDLFGIRLVHHCLNKPDPTRGKFVSLHDIGHTFVQELSNLTRQTITSPWTTTPKSDDANNAESGPITPRVSQYSAGEVDRVAELRQLGIVHGAFVQRKADSVKFKIESVSDDKVVLRRGDETLDIATPAFLKSILMSGYKVLVKYTETKEEPIMYAYACARIYDIHIREICMLLQCIYADTNQGACRPVRLQACGHFVMVIVSHCGTSDSCSGRFGAEVRLIGQTLHRQSAYAEERRLRQRYHRPRRTEVGPTYHDH